MADKQAKINLSLEGNLKQEANESARALGDLKAALKENQDALAGYRSDLKKLSESGDTSSLKALDLKKKILDLGGVMKTQRSELAGYRNRLVEIREALSAKAKAARDAAAGQKAMASAISAAGGPVSEMKGKLDLLKDLLGSGNAKAVLLAGGFALLMAAGAALTASLVSGLTSLAKWALGAADAARSMGLIREAASGSAENAANLGSQIDQLAQRVPIAKSELNALASEMARTLNNTTLSGEGIVDTFNLVAQASAAMGDTVGKQLGEIVERSKMFGRLQINPFELQGTGVKFQDVASSLAANLGTSIDTAKKALFEGRVKINDGAKAIRDAVEARFAEINARKILALPVVIEKAKEAFDSLAKSIRVAPLGAALQHFFLLFDSNATGTGRALKTLVETLGNGLVATLVKLAPLAELAFAKLVGLVLKTAIAALKLGIALKESFAGKLVERLLTTDNALGALKATFGVVVFLVGAFLAVVAAGVAELALLGAAVDAVSDYFDQLPDDLDTIMGCLGDLADEAEDWGSDLIDGLISGLKSGYGRVTSEVSGLASAVKDTFTSALGIASPSKVFAEYGRFTAEGFSQGVDSGAEGAQASVTAMAAPPSGAGGSGGGPTINLGGITVQVSGAVPQGAAATQAAQSFARQLYAELEALMTAGGIATRTA